MYILATLMGAFVGDERFGHHCVYQGIPVFSALARVENNFCHKIKGIHLIGENLLEGEDCRETRKYLAMYRETRHDSGIHSHSFSSSMFSPTSSQAATSPRCPVFAGSPYGLPHQQEFTAGAGSPTVASLYLSATPTGPKSKVTTPEVNTEPQPNVRMGDRNNSYPQRNSRATAQPLPVALSQSSPFANTGASTNPFIASTQSLPASAENGESDLTRSDGP